MPISVRLLDSPLISEDSPIAATITSDCAAIFNASSLSSSSVLLSRFSERPNNVELASSTGSLVRLLPFAYRILASLPPTDFKPSTTVAGTSSFAATLQVPTIFERVFANGPITAMVCFLANGKRFPSFFNRTKLSDAVLRATALLAGV
ncbi:hypothetical protein D3C78_1171940 [compost metagenome]